jgi:hypothetical protein
VEYFGVSLATYCSGEVMMQWEYKTIKLGTTGFLGGKFEVEELDKLLNELGSQGWDLAAAFDTNKTNGETRDVVVIFKRQRDTTWR